MKIEQSKSVGEMDRPPSVPGSKVNRLSLGGRPDVDPNSLEKQWDLESGMGSMPKITGDLSQEVDEASSYLTAGPSAEPQARLSVSSNTSIATSVGCSNDVWGSTDPREAGTSTWSKDPETHESFDDDPVQHIGRSASNFSEISLAGTEGSWGSVRSSIDSAICMDNFVPTRAGRASQANNRVSMYSVISFETIYELPESPPAIDQENPEVTDFNTDEQVSNWQLTSVSSHLQSTEEEPPDDNTTPDKPKTSRIANFVQFILRIASTCIRNPEVRSERKPFYYEPSAENGEYVNPTFTFTEPITNSPPPTLSQEYIDCSSELTTHVNERKTDIKKPTFPEFTLEKTEFLESFDRMLEIAKSRGIDVVGHNFQIANFAAAILDCHGGCLSIDGLDVHLYVPPGAIPEEQTQLVYIYVTGTSSVQSHYFSTPFVHCGPPDTIFKEDVVLTVPHCVKNTSSCKFSLSKLSSGGSSELREGSDVITVVDNDSITFSVNHFCGFGATASPVDGSILEKTMIACLFIHEDSHSDDEVTLRLRLVDDVQANVQEVTTEERNYGFHLADTKNPLTVFKNDQDVVAKISTCSCESWELSEPESCQRKIHRKSLWRETDESCARAFPSVLFVAKRRSGSQKVCFKARMTVLQEGSGSCDYGVNFLVDLNKRCCLPNPGKPHNIEEFLLGQIPNDRNRVTECRLLQEPIFSKLCKLLDTPNPLENDWRRLSSLLLKTEHNVDSINAKAGRERSSPTKIILDLFFGKQSGKKKEETLDTLKCALIGINRPDAMFAVDAIEEQIKKKLSENRQGRSKPCKPIINANPKSENTHARIDRKDSAYNSFVKADEL